MEKLKPFLFGAITGAGLVFLALQYHVVQSQDGFRIVPRTPQHSIGLAYADIRHFSADDWQDRPELAQALVAHGSTDLVGQTVANDLVNKVTENSPLDQLRGFLNESDRSVADDEDSFFDGFLPEPSPDRDPARFDRLLNEPLSRGGQDRNSTPADKSKSAPAPWNEARVTQRERPSIADAFGRSGNTIPEDRERSTTSTADSQSWNDDRMSNDRSAFSESYGSDSGSENTNDYFRETVPTPRQTMPANRPTFTPEEETDMLEQMLFGAEDSGTAEDGHADTGVFQEITDTLDRRASEALARARQGFQRETQESFTDVRDSMTRKVTSGLEGTVPDSVKSFLRSQQPSTNTATESVESAIPPAIKALQDGRNPFFDF